ncbi:methionine/alanine import family NSS transporter small subunit [Corynebacterium choanae]|uniref:Uncharacterized protein n=1 Tax=Corynebacterium choanae TaxID=1862358 RepID=A0A3G6J901_9CORY|nr:methionine/alanine import family NSS transporter small subunit [Corynebacterium choanae]AZA14253.1 hypothetical protein CCHOA_09350 [Corynebacterium choanae]
MTTTTLIIMVLYLAVVWGLLALATYHLSRTNDDTCGTLGTQNLDDMPQYTTPAVVSR